MEKKRGMKCTMLSNSDRMYLIQALIPIRVEYEDNPTRQEKRRMMREKKMSSRQFIKWRKARNKELKNE